VTLLALQSILKERKPSIQPTDLIKDAAKSAHLDAAAAATAHGLGILQIWW